MRHYPRPAGAALKEGAERQPVEHDRRDRHHRSDSEIEGQQHQEAEPGRHDQTGGMNLHFSRTRVPRIFWLLSALRKFGTRRSISSKYDDSAGVFVCAL